MSAVNEEDISYGTFDAVPEKKARTQKDTSTSPSAGIVSSHQVPTGTYDEIKKCLQKKKEEESAFFANSLNDPNADALSMEPLLVATEMSREDADEFFLSPTADKGSFVYSCADKTLFLVKLSLEPGNTANRALDAFDDAYTVGAAVGRLKGLSQQDLIVNNKKCKPDGVICPRIAAPGERRGNPPERIAFPRLIREVEYHHRSFSELHTWALELLEDVLLRAFVGVIIYNEHPNRTRASLAVIYLKVNTNQVHITKMISFGTHDLHHDVISVVNNLEVPGGTIAPLTVLPCPVLANPHINYAGIARPVPWHELIHHKIRHLLAVQADALFYGVPGGAGDCPNYVVDLWTILTRVATVSNIDE